MSKSLIFLFILALTSSKIAGKTVDSKKYALVVGVSNYSNISPLKNTLNDANDIASKLNNLGFNVTKLLDPTLRQVSDQIDTIATNLDSTSTMLFYFSGHGAEYNGENYLFLKNSKPSLPVDIPYETYPLGKLFGKLEFMKTKTSIIILDACRSNPYVKSWSRNSAFQEGLANMNAPAGIFIGYAASPGKTASDGSRKNGTYTEAILKFIDAKNTSLDDIFNKVNKEVRVQSAGLQVPFKNSSLDDNFYFNIDSNLELPSPNLGYWPTGTQFSIAQVNKPIFPLPAIMKGYQDNSINSYAQATISKTTFHSGEIVDLFISAFDTTLWNRTTPIYVHVVRKASPNMGGVSVYREQFQPQTSNTNIRVSISLDPGTYEISFGFYLLSEINQEYPQFYSRRAMINVM